MSIFTVIRQERKFMKDSHTLTKSLYQLYKQWGLSVEQIDPSSGFTIVHLNEFNWDLPFESPSFRPDYFSFLFIKEGAGKYSIDNNSFTVVPHSVYFTNPSNYRTFSWTAIDQITLLTFDESFLKEYLGNTIFETFPFLLTEIVSPKVVDPQFFEQMENLYLQIHREYQERSTDTYTIIGHLLTVLLYKIKAYFWLDYNPLQEGSRSSVIVSQFKRDLEQHYRDLIEQRLHTPFRVTDYAMQQNLHPNYLSQVIKSKTGKSVTQWMTDKSIIEAKSLLQNSSKSIKEIAFLLGFTESSHFSNYFKKNTHTSATSYRSQFKNTLISKT